MDVEIKSHYLQGRCPVCGGRIVKTGKGYACENSIPQDPLCGFHVPGILANRKITDSEMEDFLAGNAQVLDGFSNNEGKVFSSVLTLAEDGKVVLDSRIAVCPVCGGDILVSPQAFNCSNYSNPQVKCKFMAWRNIAGHVITKQVVYMNKSDLIQVAAAKTGLSQQQARECLDAFLGAIGKEMKDGGEVVITDFGRFFTKKMPQRTVTLPDGRSSVVLERENVKFKAFQNIKLYNVKY